MPELAIALRDEDQLLRMRAVGALAAIPHSDAVRALIPMLGDSSSADVGYVRDKFAAALRERGEAELVKMVFAVFAGDLTALTRYEGEYRAEVIDALAEALGGYFSGINAARALAEVHAVEALPRLRAALGKVGTRDPIGQAIAQAIKTLEDRASLPRPADGTDPEAASLPRAARDPGPGTETLPRGVAGEE